MPLHATKNIVFQEFLTLLGKMVHSDLIRQIEYLKVENQIESATPEATDKCNKLTCGKRIVTY